MRPRLWGEEGCEQHRGVTEGLGSAWCWGRGGSWERAPADLLHSIPTSEAHMGPTAPCSVGLLPSPNKEHSMGKSVQILCPQGPQLPGRTAGSQLATAAN